MNMKRVNTERNIDMKCIKTVSSEEIFFQEKQVLEGNAPTWQENCMVNVFDDVTYQEILGFGAAFTEAAAYNYSLMDEKNKRLFMQKYFSKEDGSNKKRCSTSLFLR